MSHARVPFPGGKYFLVGGAGFIGSHFTDTLLASKDVTGVTLYDNFSSGREWHYAHHAKDSRLKVVRGDVNERDKMTAAMKGHDTVIHFASNPDIAKAATEPDIDFREGTALTNHVVEAMRVSGTKRILYTSGSGVYGDLGEKEAFEDWGPMIPVSTYGASKLAGEALIASYCFMFDMTACIFRFGNVVGPRQTHGVGFDFIRRLKQDPTKLSILGNGTQSKSYVYVTDVVDAVLTAHFKSKATVGQFNVATGDYITVREIAEVALECLGLDTKKTDLQFGTANRGWKGDVPVIRMNTDRIRGLGWNNTRTSREAIRDSIQAMLPDLERGLFS
ncbi:MAG: NAD-dependent epimerase/dehydratase family protein [Polyangiaceae bacterium]